VEVPAGGVEVDRSHEHDDAGVEGREVRDRAEDVAEGDVAATVSGRHGDSAYLLDLDGGCDGGVAEEAL
jgi:hypothetical protein